MSCSQLAPDIQTDLFSTDVLANKAYLEQTVDKKEDYDIDDNLIDLFYNEGKLYIKDLEKNDLSPDYSGIRPKVWIDGNPMPDFYINHEEDKGYPGLINLIGIESPGLTASLAIGNNVVEMIN